MTKTPETIGAFLTAAERRLAQEGGYQARVDCTARTVTLLRVDDGDKIRIATATLPDGVAGEDVARDMLERHAALGGADPAHLQFARDIYFPIDFV